LIRTFFRRAGGSVGVLLVLTLVTFYLARVVPNDPALIYIGAKATPQQVAALHEKLGLNDPMAVQYLHYLKSLLTGDWGTSLATKQPVLGEIGSRLPPTLELIAAAMTLGVVVGVALGVLGAKRPGSRVDGLVRFLSIGGVAVPSFWLGLLLQMVFVGWLKLLPATGEFSNDIRFTSPVHHVTGLPLLDSMLTGNWLALGDGLTHLILPALTLATYPIGLIARMTRSSMIEALGQDYITAAAAYGLPRRQIVNVLALRNSLTPTLTVIGLSIAFSVTGTFFVETVFNWPGIGQFATQAMINIDYPAILAITLLGAVAYLMTNMAVDLLQARVDRRMAA
jgi:peptide/nickel transport system permease protein